MTHSLNIQIDGDELRKAVKGEINGFLSSYGIPASKWDLSIGRISLNLRLAIDNESKEIDVSQGETEPADCKKTASFIKSLKDASLTQRRVWLDRIASQLKEIEGEKAEKKRTLKDWACIALKAVNAVEKKENEALYTIDEASWLFLSGHGQASFYFKGDKEEICEELVFPAHVEKAEDKFALTDLSVLFTAKEALKEAELLDNEGGERTLQEWMLWLLICRLCRRGFKFYDFERPENRPEGVRHSFAQFKTYLEILNETGGWAYTTAARFRILEKGNLKLVEFNTPSAFGNKSWHIE